MVITDVISIGAAVITSLGGGGLIVFALSSWLGKVWADRLMARETHQYALKLEEMRESLRFTSEQELASLKAQLEIAKETKVQEHLDRVTIYRGTVDLIAGIIAKIEMIMLQRRPPLSNEEIHEFEMQRLRIYAYLAMHAPQSVMDAHDQLSDLILSLVYDGKQTTWEQFRELSINLLNEVRKDIGIRDDSITYRGKR